MPGYFETATTIDGMLATDIFTLNQAFSATIEEQVVGTLNSMRSVWDPEKRYQPYIFVRQTQTFPDVLLMKRQNGRDILLGIELKGWYVLAKEGMPNFRFTVTRAACARADLLVVVPWALTNVISGAPKVFSPFIELATYCADMRNFYWTEARQAAGDSRITLAEGVQPYPSKKDRIADRANSDGGGNFGRLARYGIMKRFIEETLDTNIRGIPARDWFSFFKRFKDSQELSIPEEP